MTSSRGGKRRLRRAEVVSALVGGLLFALAFPPLPAAAFHQGYLCRKSVYRQFASGGASEVGCNLIQLHAVRELGHR